LLRKNHTAEEMANGKVGPQNQSERYFGKPGTLNEQRIPKVYQLWAATPRGQQHV